MSKSPDRPPAAVLPISNVHAPEVFATCATGVGFVGGSGLIRMTFASHRPSFDLDGSSQVHRVENLRLVMPTADVREMVALLQRLLDAAALNAAIPPPDKPLQ